MTSEIKEKLLLVGYTTSRVTHALTNQSAA